MGLKRQTHLKQALTGLNVTALHDTADYIKMHDEDPLLCRWVLILEGTSDQLNHTVALSCNDSI